ncbi:hypothetical protein FA15DRAFT_663719 [Coprinopsis marcescibilis]|uniref:Uncharacterized protein n=1 Tax=Coprinopsis marcescibilis TaxID=230819 RepID=A0A5C3L9Y5_COPMA|nr:hypothetical protein FA15DRAFT_663719 [Coprinopsis marcescibilis]
MAATPRHKGVHWNFAHPSPSELSSPSIADDSSASLFPTSSLDYVNGQLVAHGFPAPGLSLDGVSPKDSERVVKCLLTLLSQRMEDIARTEDLTTKFRTLTYDNQRLTSLHRSAVEAGANAEREMNLHKSKLTSTLRTLASTETAHKQTTLELQRTRTSLQAIRTTHQTELKKKEKDFEKMAEKWQKIADVQAKLSSTSSGIYCANVSAVEGRNSLKSTASYLEVALDEAEKARSALVEDNKHLKTLVLKAVNSIQRILYQTRVMLSENVEEPTSFTITTLFPIASSSTPNEKLTTLLSGLRDGLETVSEKLAVPPAPSESRPSASGSNSTDPTEAERIREKEEEIQRLQKAISNLQHELERCKKQLDVQSKDMQNLLDNVAQQRQVADAESEQKLFSASAIEEEQDRLDELREELENEKDKFAEAATRLSKEKSALESQRLKFLDEKRIWEMQRHEDTAPTDVKRSKHRVKDSPRKALRTSKRSPRKSPAKAKFMVSVNKHSGSPKKGGRSGGAAIKISLSSPSKVIPAYETEVIPPFPKLQSSLAPPSDWLPPAFVLPPPSPRASLPSEPVLPPPKAQNNSRSSGNLAPVSEATEDAETSPATPSPPRRPFPMAKPFAQRMVHAYSPAKPSPLSRILQLSNSPLELPELPSMSIDGDIPGDEYEYEDEEDDDSPPGLNEGYIPQPQASEPQMSLAAELGVTESPPDTPLQDNRAVTSRAAPPVRGRVLFPKTQQATKTKPSSSSSKTTLTKDVKGKGKSKAEPAQPAPRTRPPSATGQVEKTGTGRLGKTSPVFKPPTAVPSTKDSSRSNGMAKPSAPPKASSSTAKTTTAKPAGAGRTSTSGKPLPPAGGGPRRVPIDSLEAAKGRKI